VSVVTPLLLAHQNTEAITASNGIANWWSVSCRTQCFGDLVTKAKHWMMQTCSPWNDKKHSTIPASNGCPGKLLELHHLWHKWHYAGFWQ
jgi:hypothetical protein